MAERVALRAEIVGLLMAGIGKRKSGEAADCGRKFRFDGSA
jgi:hypothetical protein